jgi:hypothetical protein
MRGSKINSEPPLWAIAITLAEKWHVTPWEVWENMTSEWYHRINAYEWAKSKQAERTRKKHGKKSA